MAYFSEDFNSGFALQTDESTSATITSANFPHSFSAPDAIKIDAAATTIKAPTINGIVQVLPGKKTAMLPDSTMHINGLEGPFFAAAGFTSASTGYVLGAPISGTTNAGRTSTKCLTIVQYGGDTVRTLTNAKPATFAINIKSGDPVELKQSFQGRGTEAPTEEGFKYIKYVSTNAPMIALGLTVSISGQSVKYSECSLDLGISLQQIDDASESTGVGEVEIVSYDPKFTINPASTTSTRAFFQTLESHSVVPIVITGTANGKTYTISFNAYVSEINIAKDNDIRIQNQVWGLVAQNDKTLVKVSIS